MYLLWEANKVLVSVQVFFFSQNNFSAELPLKDRHAVHEGDYYFGINAFSPVLSLYL